ncbi:C-C motif chemokine 3-like [Phascolarctos cinereus]|uniref:C-C motif chemokine 3-like n=1 Tax=Phascolarctos cinereus TaxID=38626 RepID=A0A6P5LS71_PHACI|nr:C-C motif chemokine 3-like [Phascolarctos cinereus]XP_020861410.1 C-C motif chemokine 3-like [Phascolarctos cinereus]XP_020861416.1 C-C motif chemokine 3-like [Phascolarctos cinereus]
MGVLVAVFSFFLLLLPSGFCLVMSVKHAASTDFVPCCNNFISHRIPQSLVIGFVRTSPQCPKPGVLFETKQGLKVCANPAVHWVQRYIKSLGFN